ncbi:hypothetical protein, partial [Thermoactinomyces sp. CICC 10521]|uniref:hypothetical protein n=1 Tax=Thermoactinomyces sp. CICC 10521 TaxID=2767426 RepID=UPI0018DD5AC3
MNKYFYRFMIIVLLTFVGVGILGSGQVQASGGSFNVPQVNDHFEKVQKGPAPEKEPSLSQEPQKEHGTWDWLTKPLKSAWNSTKETVSSAWNKTKEVCSEAWDWICNVCDQMTKVVVDGLSSAWDWIVKYKEYVAFTAVVIVGIALCLVPPLGEEILAGVALSFIIRACPVNILRFHDKMKINIIFRKGTSMMRRRYEITDEAWEKIAPLLPSNGKRGGQWK